MSGKQPLKFDFLKLLESKNQLLIFLNLLCSNLEKIPKDGLAPLDDWEHIFDGGSSDFNLEPSTISFATTWALTKQRTAPFLPIRPEYPTRTSTNASPT